MPKLHCIFHHPVPVNSGGKSGNRVRPYKMLEAFKAIGFSVEEVTGHGRDRKRQINKITRDIADGKTYQFAYSESESHPTMLTEESHLPLYPRMDFAFFSHLRKRGIPVGLFYRDIYWRFDLSAYSWWKRPILKYLYLYDLRQYQQNVDWLFLPSIQMAEYLPGKWNPKQLSELPPGSDVVGGIHDGRIGNQIHGLYVGGVLPPYYDISPLLSMTKAESNFSLTICCRKDEWAIACEIYGKLPENISIVHRGSDGLADLYDKADVFMIVREHHPYLEFSAPIKFYEALGHGLPIITSPGTAVSSVVEKNGIGWVINHEVKEFKRVLQLMRSVEARQSIGAALESFRSFNTWESRAEEVAKTLMRSELQTLSN